MRTYTPKAAETQRKWHLFDAKGKILGRLASEIAPHLMGKLKPGYSAHLDTGDNVVVLNAEKIEVSGRKEKQKSYYRHSGYSGGLSETPVIKMRQEHPERIVKFAVSGMLPRNKLHDSRLRRLHVIVGETNPYEDKFQTKN